MSNFTYVAALLFELLHTLQSALLYSRENGVSKYTRYPKKVTEFHINVSFEIIGLENQFGYF